MTDLLSFAWDHGITQLLLGVFSYGLFCHIRHCFRLVRKLRSFEMEQYSRSLKWNSKPPPSNPDYATQDKKTDGVNVELNGPQPVMQSPVQVEQCREPITFDTGCRITYPGRSGLISSHCLRFDGVMPTRETASQQHRQQASRNPNS